MRKSIGSAIVAVTVLSSGALLSGSAQAMVNSSGARAAFDAVNPVEKAACWRRGWHGWGWYPCWHGYYGWRGPGWRGRYWGWRHHW